MFTVLSIRVDYSVQLVLMPRCACNMNLLVMYEVLLSTML